MSVSNASFRVTRRDHLRGVIRPPGDKSVSHRAAILCALASGRSEITNFLPSQDCLATVRCMCQLGADLRVRRGVGSDWELLVEGNPELREPDDVLDCGNSGTTMRLLSGVLASRPFFSALTGDASLRSRPMARVVHPLRQMGAIIDGRDGGRLAPLFIRGATLVPIDYISPVASAQVKSAILLAGLRTDGRTSVTEPIQSRDHTERMLPAMGASIEVGGLRVSVDGPSTLSGVRFEVPGDFSSAAFFLVAALLAPDSEVILESVGVNPTRVGLLNVLKRMGAKIDVVSERMEAGEPVADIIASSSLLSGTVVAADEIPSLVDEIPILAVAASVANGDTWIQGAGELRVKETDRLAAVCSQLRLMGAQIEETTDGLKVYGPSRLCGTHLTSFGDHRMAMSLAIAGLIADGETVIGDFECVATSFPDFEKHLRRLSGLWQ